MGRTAALVVLVGLIIGGYGSARTAAVAARETNRRSQQLPSARTRASSASPSKAQLIALANAICTRADRRIAPLEEAISAELPGSSPVAHARIAQHVAAAQVIELAAAARLRALVPPTRRSAPARLQLVNSRADLRSMPITVQAVVAAIAHAVRVKASGLPVVVAALEDIHVSGAEAEASLMHTSSIGRRIEAYGFRACGSAL